MSSLSSQLSMSPTLVRQYRWNGQPTSGISWPPRTQAHPRKPLVEYFRAAAWRLHSNATQTMKRWMRKNKRPLFAYLTRLPKDRAPPIPLPETRKRALSIGAVPRLTLRDRITPGTEVQVTYTQKQCIFLTRLPPEIRLIIYEYVLGGRVLHIIPSLIPSRTKEPNDHQFLLQAHSASHSHAPKPTGLRALQGVISHTSERYNARPHAASALSMLCLD